MPEIIIHQERAAQGDKSKLVNLCPFGAIEENAQGALEINSNCKACQICVKKGGGVFEFVETNSSARPKIDRSKFHGVAVVGEIAGGKIHPVTLELLGKAAELAGKLNEKVLLLLIGHHTRPLAEPMLDYAVDTCVFFDQKELEDFRIEPYTAALEKFIRTYHPGIVLVGGTTVGRSLAPRTAARFGTGLTADCTSLDVQPNGNLDQIRPAYGGNIMAHINTPDHRPQFATVRYKIFSIPQKSLRHGKIESLTLSPAELVSGIEILQMHPKRGDRGIEEAEVLIAAGRAFQKKEDLALVEKLAELLHGEVASSRALVEAGWMDPRRQIGLSGRTVKPKLLITCGISGAIQFVAGMSGAEKIVAINSDPDAAIFKVAHIGIVGNLYEILPSLIADIQAKKTPKAI
ncbi:MAG: electron transfer flavoprotein subunit alpha [Victivallaceae bacterium]|nr:electron transfer flavoprotein subunit alpha [Victivallaceae bacterium]